MRKFDQRGITQKKLDMETLYLRMYADGSFANNADSTTQLGYAVLLCDDDDNSNVFQYSLHTHRKVLREVLGGEVMAFTNEMDCEITVREHIEGMKQ